MMQNQPLSIPPLKIITWFILFVGIFLIIKIQFSIPTLWEADGYYHIRMAHLFRTEGMPKQLLWAKYSYFATHFADKDFLYHYLLVPFTLFSDIFYGAKVAAALFSILLFLTFYWVIKKYSSEYAVPFFLVLFFLSSQFLEALGRPRPMILAIALMVWFIHSVIKRNSISIFFSMLIYGFMHISALIMVFYAIIIEVLRYLEVRFFKEQNEVEIEKEFLQSSFSFKSIGIAVFALLLSYGFHPHFPNNLLVLYLNLFLVPYYAFKGGVLELGAEFFPINTKDLILGYPSIIFVLLFLFYLILNKKIRTRFVSKVWVVCGLILFIAGFFSQRYLLHAYPLLLIGFAACFSDLIEGEFLEKILKFKKTLMLSLFVFFIGVIQITSSAIKQNIYVENIVNSHYEQVGVWFSKNVPPGETLFHSNWSDSQYFIGLNPQNNYFVTLDPIYMYAWNPQLYQLYREVAHGKSKDPYYVLKNIFQVHYGYIGRNYFTPMIQQIAQDSRFTILAQDALGVIFKLN